MCISCERYDEFFSLMPTSTIPACCPMSIGVVTENRCLVPVTSFAERDPASQKEGGKVPNAWLVCDEEKSLMFFAGIHVPQWQSVRKVRDGLTTDDLYGFLTTDPNDLVKPIHEKAME